MRKRQSFPHRFPDSEGAKRWPGMWSYGVDFTDGGCARVIAVRLGDGDIKYGTDWCGPIDLREKTTIEALMTWAENALDISGGYVHLFPADGDASRDLLKETEKAND